MIYLCEKHGKIEGKDRIKWTDIASEIWCRFCINEMMDKHCSKIHEIPEIHEPPTFKFNDNRECNHDWDNGKMLLSHPPKYACKKCGLIKTQ
jgi:hypothetical protein